MTMQTYYCTFGFNHYHPETKVPMKDYWVEIEADSIHKVSKKMFEIFNNAWGVAYHEKAFLRMRHLFPKNCFARYEVD